MDFKDFNKLMEGKNTFSCPECGEQVEEDYDYCPHCDADVKFLGTCPECGQEIRGDEEQSCPNCGYYPGDEEDDYEEEDE